MRILVVGGGGREHALVWKLAKSPLVEEVIAAPGNAGMSGIARCEPVSGTDIQGQIELAKREGVDLVVVGPEAPLVEGIADEMRRAGLAVFGPSKAAARLEGSKIFSKEFMARAGIPTAAFTVHDTLASALEEVERRSGPCVVKADGLAAGKGVVVCRDSGEARRALEEMMADRRFGDAGDRVIIEDLLEGEEASVLAICDGRRFIPLVAAQDHKAAYEGDTGPNTGGMGAYAPAPVITEAMTRKVINEVLTPAMDKMAEEGNPFVGVLYAGLMLVDGVPYVLEFNVRFGDPECQPLMALMKEDLAPVLKKAAEGTLESKPLEWYDGATMCVVLAAGGYPGHYEQGNAISGIDAAEEDAMVTVFHAGTKRSGDAVVTAGGRVLGVTARGETLQEARDRAYRAADKIGWDGMRLRRDIGHRAL
jgi:phosphoribosylamine---glycine ligase